MTLTLGECGNEMARYTCPISVTITVDLDFEADTDEDAEVEVEDKMKLLYNEIEKVRPLEAYVEFDNPLVDLAKG
jgi:hypothetical protein